MRITALIRPIPFEFKPVLAAVLIMICSVLLSIYYLDWVHLERSGALLVIVALLFFWRDQLSEKKERIQDYIDVDDYNKKNTKTIKSITDLKNTEWVMWFSVDKKKVKDGLKRDKKKYQAIEVLVACTGTFIWAYGKATLQSLFPL
ncbi:MAG: hypothetical protein ACI9D5_001639 [Candidatus Endobugula sp.]|jgi:hypothetical protein